MDTNDFADTLAKGLKPVRRLGPPPLRGAAWALVAAALGAAAVALLGGPRYDIDLVSRDATFVIDTTLMTVSALLAAIAACQLAAPQTEIGLGTKFLLVVSSGLWLLQALDATVAADGFAAEAHLRHPHIVHDCLLHLSAIMAAPLAVLWLLLRRGASTHGSWAGYAMALAAAAAAALALRCFCPIDAPAHLLVWHILPVPLYALLGLLFGRWLLHW